jgi:DNA-binding PadR family transcriptional regulator
MPGPSLTSPELVALLLLAERPRCGYELLGEKRLAQAFGRPAVSSSSVYHLLSSLASRGLLVAREECPATAPVRQVYRPSRSARTLLSRHVGRELSGLRLELERLVDAYKRQKSALLLVESLLR